jgi:Fe-S cluster assembly protein SufD
MRPISPTRDGDRVWRARRDQPLPAAAREPGGVPYGDSAVHQDRSSHVTSHVIALGGALARNEVTVVLDGEGSECTLNGLFMVAGQQHVDNQTRIEHVQPYCTSRELYKGVLDGKGRGVFNGTIYVHKAAQKSNAKQTNKNLLLSPDAWINTKPQLEIYNNDVKCGHGSTIGRLDEEALFYLRCRGIWSRLMAC